MERFAESQIVLPEEAREEVFWTEYSLRMRELLSRTHPHRVIIGMFWLAGWDEKRIANEISSLTLSAALEQAEKAMLEYPKCMFSQVLSWCDVVKSNLEKRIADCDVLPGGNSRERKKLSSISNSARGRRTYLGETRLREYFGQHATQDIARSCGELIESASAARTCSGDAAFNKLRNSFKEQIKVRILTSALNPRPEPSETSEANTSPSPKEPLRARSDTRKKLCAEVERKVWAFARQELQHYNPGRETMAEFFRYHCDVLCLDSDAFDRLMADQAGLVLPRLKGRAVPRPEHDYEDIAQSIWVDVFRRLPVFNPFWGDIDIFISNICNWHIKRTYIRGCRSEPPSDSDLHGRDKDEESPTSEPPIETEAPLSRSRLAAVVEEIPDPKPDPSKATAAAEWHRAGIEVCRSFLQAVAEDCDQPHQNIAYCLVQAAKCKPSVIVQRDWRRSLSELVDLLESSLLADFGEEKDKTGRVLMPGISALDVAATVAPLRASLVDNDCGEKSFADYVNGDLPNGPQKELLSSARDEFVKYEIEGRIRRKQMEDTKTKKAAAEKGLRKEWERMPSEEQNDWCDQVRANFISRWVSNISRRTGVQRARVNLDKELRRIAAAESD